MNRTKLPRELIMTYLKTQCTAQIVVKKNVQREWKNHIMMWIGKKYTEKYFKLGEVERRWGNRETERFKIEMIKCKSYFHLNVTQKNTKSNCSGSLFLIFCSGFLSRLRSQTPSEEEQTFSFTTRLKKYESKKNWQF